MRGAESYTFIRTPMETPAQNPITDIKETKELEDFSL
jgi:hypothetical protein